MLTSDISSLRTTAVLATRRAGMLLHPTSLPGGPLHGDFGAACDFIDFLSDCGMSVWQMLPLGPTHSERSPYACLSSHAGNPALISLDRLVDAGWLEAAPPAATVEERSQRLQQAYQAFVRRAAPKESAELAAFRLRHEDWLKDYALYQSLRQRHGGKPWWQWPVPLRKRQAAALQTAQTELSAPIDQHIFEQFVFFRQWREIRDYAVARGVYLFGDMPIFVAHDSAEVWAQRQYFSVDARGELQTVAGVPPDYFSADGQRWGNPLYNWKRLQADGFRWWKARLQTQLELFDLVRIDHFRGFEAYWEIPATAATAAEGRWVQAPGNALFSALRESFDPLPLVAEDLGLITPAVEELRRNFGLAGMKVLQFAFGGDADNPYLPHHHEPHSIVYTGTHDNDTTVGWCARLSAQERQHVLEYLGVNDEMESLPWSLVRAAFASVARLAILPLQDALMLGSEHRMNAPGTAQGNWAWRFEWQQIPAELPARLRHWVTLYGRSGRPSA